jgi:hypothetical protein
MYYFYPNRTIYFYFFIKTYFENKMEIFLTKRNVVWLFEFCKNGVKWYLHFYNYTLVYLVWRKERDYGRKKITEINIWTLTRVSSRWRLFIFVRCFVGNFPRSRFIKTWFVLIMFERAKCVDTQCWR